MALAPADLRVRHHVLTAMASGAVPSRVSVMQALGMEYADVSASYLALDAAHVIVLDADTGEVRMALPFSAVPTDFPVMAGGRAVWANCAWDAFGVASALDCDVSFVTPCLASGALINAGVRHGVAFSDAGVVARVGVPAAKWWDDIGYT